MNFLDIIQGVVPTVSGAVAAGREADAERQAKEQADLLAAADRAQARLREKRQAELDAARLAQIREASARAAKPAPVQTPWQREGFGTEAEYLEFVRRQTAARTRVPAAQPSTTPSQPQGPQLTPPQIEQINNLDNVINIATDAERQMRGAIASGANATGRLFGVLPLPTAVRDITNQGGTQGRAARIALGNLFSTIAQLRSGAAISASEMERLEAFLPSMQDDEEVAQQKLNGVLRALRQLRATRMRNYAQYGRGGQGIRQEDLSVANDIYDQFGLERPE